MGPSGSGRRVSRPPDRSSLAPHTLVGRRKLDLEVQDGRGRLVVVLAPGLKMLMVAFEPQDASVALYLETLRRASHAGTAEPPSSAL